MGRSCDVRAILACAFAFAFACVGATADGQKGVSITLTTEWTVRLVRHSRHRRAAEDAARSLSPIAPEDRSAPRLSD
jgi:steroid 5-alpha reductase family enzyme